MKIKIIKKFEIMPDKWLTVTGNIITVRETAGYRAVKGGYAISIDHPELNPVKKAKKAEIIKDKKEK